MSAPAAQLGLFGGRVVRLPIEISATVIPLRSAIERRRARRVALDWMRLVVIDASAQLRHGRHDHCAATLTDLRRRLDELEAML